MCRITLTGEPRRPVQIGASERHRAVIVERVRVCSGDLVWGHLRDVSSAADPRMKPGYTLSDSPAQTRSQGESR
jgi:hypothetical protein